MAEEEGGEGRKKKRGRVKWFNGWKGFGFITPDLLEDEEPSDDLFVHQTCIQFDGFRTLYDGQRVEFEVEVAQDGRSRATEVVPLGRRVVECYNCGRYGHFARDCYEASRGGGRRGRGRRGGGGGRRGGCGGGRRVDCYHCGEEGHFARDCPN